MADWFDDNSPNAYTFRGAGQNPGPMRSINDATVPTTQQGAYTSGPGLPPGFSDPPTPSPYQPDVPHTVIVNGRPQPQGPGGIGMSPTGGGSGNPMDREWVKQQILQTARQMQASGQYVNPSVFNDTDYWADRILEQGGWGDFGPNKNNIAYFSGRFGMPEGAPAGGGGDVLNSPLMKGYDQQMEWDPNNALKTPAFEAAKQRGLQALENSAAARGTVLSSGVMKDIAEWVTGLGLDAMNQDFNRTLSTHEFNRGTQWGNTDRQFQRLADYTRLGQNGASLLNDSTNIYGRQTQAVAEQQANNTTNQGNAEANAALAGGSRPTDWSYILNNKGRYPAHRGGGPR